MKEVKAIIRPFMQERVLRALGGIAGLPGVTLPQVVGWGKGLPDKDHQALQEPATAFSPKTKLEIVIPDALLDVVLDTIARSAHTGDFGDGKIFVYEIRDVVRIRTNERGEATI